MICPNKKCKRETRVLLVIVDKDGTKREGCHTCLSRQPIGHLYSGKKIWSGDDVYGREGCSEKNHEWGQKIAARAERKRMLVSAAPR